MNKNEAFAEVRRVGLIVEEVPRTVIDRIVWVLGERFDADDLYETLCEIKSSASSTVITCERTVRMLQSIGVIGGTSRSWGTSITSEKKLSELVELLRAARRERSDVAA